MQTRTARTLSAIVVATAMACSDRAVLPTETKLPQHPSLVREEAPLLVSAAEPVRGQYIVVLADNADPASVLASHALPSLHTYRHSIRGFAAKLSREQLDRLRHDGAVRYVEQDAVVRTGEDGAPRPAAPPSAPSTQSSQANPPWGLDRIDQPLGLNNNYTFTNTGKGVKVYVVGTGIRFTHAEFDGISPNRAKTGIDLVTPGGPAADCNGHSTHMAGTIGGSTVGVARGTTLYAVRVLDCNGTGLLSTVIAAVDWVTYNHVSPSVGHAALGGVFSQAVNDAFTKSTLYGTLWVTAAGSSGSDACNVSPAATPLAMTVAASDAGDNRAAFSNSGPCVDLYAPGVNVLSAYFTSDNAFVTWSGTSSASAHVAGLAALFLQSKPTATPTEVRDVLALNAQPNVIGGNPVNTPNLLANKQTGVCVAAGAYCAGVTGSPQFPVLGAQLYYLSGAGMQRGYLRGTPGTDFDLELYEWNGAAWILRVNSTGATTNPTIQFNSACAFGLGNCYKMYRVKSAAGTGSFDFWYDRQ